MTETPDTNLIPLADICKSHFDLSFVVARRRFAAGTLPIKAFRLNNSRRGPIFVHRADLDALIARRRGVAA